MIAALTYRPYNLNFLYKKIYIILCFNFNHVFFRIWTWNVYQRQCENISLFHFVRIKSIINFRSTLINQICNALKFPPVYNARSFYFSKHINRTDKNRHICWCCTNFDRAFPVSNYVSFFSYVTFFHVVRSAHISRVWIIDNF